MPWPILLNVFDQGTSPIGAQANLSKMSEMYDVLLLSRKENFDIRILLPNIPKFGNFKFIALV